MPKLFFDIETVPAPASQHGLLQEILAMRQAKGQDLEETIDSFIGKSGLSGEFGRIVCLAYAIDDGPVEVLWGEETEILEGFWQVAVSVTRFIGHNVLDFDFPFIMKRSRILGIKPSRTISFARFRQDPIYDTMHEWTLWNRPSVSLDTLAKAFGLPTSKDTMDGSEVAGYFAAGRIEEICDYCKKDVVLTRHVYDRMTFGESVGASKAF